MLPLTDGMTHNGINRFVQVLILVGGILACVALIGGNAIIQPHSETSKMPFEVLLRDTEVVAARQELIVEFKNISNSSINLQKPIGTLNTTIYVKKNGTSHWYTINHAGSFALPPPIEIKSGDTYRMNVSHELQPGEYRAYVKYQVVSDCHHNEWKGDISSAVIDIVIPKHD